MVIAEALLGVRIGKGIRVEALGDVVHGLEFEGPLAEAVLHGDCQNKGLTDDRVGAVPFDRLVTSVLPLRRGSKRGTFCPTDSVGGGEA